MNFGTLLVTLTLILLVAAIIRSLIKDKLAGKNVGCGACKNCTHAFSSQMACSSGAAANKTSLSLASPALGCTCASADKLLAEIELAAALPEETSPHNPSSNSNSVCKLSRYVLQYHAKRGIE